MAARTRPRCLQRSRFSKDPIEEAVDNREDLDEEVLRTVWHEVGHFLGFDEDEVADMGLG